MKFLNGVTYDSAVPKELRDGVEVRIPLVKVEVLSATRILQPEHIVKVSSLFDKIAYELPLTMKQKTWKLIYSKEVHGSSFKSFYAMVAGEEQTILVVQDKRNNVSEREVGVRSVL